MPQALKLTQNLNHWLPGLIQLWRRQAKSQWLDSPRDTLPAAEAKSIAAAIQRLSLGLTRQRHLAASDYLSHPHLAGAYLLYFWPISYAQACLTLPILPQPPHSLLELGCGAAPFAAAAYDQGISQITLADQNPKILAWARQLMQGHGHAPQTLLWNAKHLSTWPDSKYDLIVLQQVLNELWVNDAARIKKCLSLLKFLLLHLNPQGHLLLIEPALKSTSQAVLQLRDHLCQMNYSVVFPCLHAKACPALQAGDSCHAEAEWDPPHLVENLIVRAGLHKPRLKMTILIFGPPPLVAAFSPPLVFLALSAPKRSRQSRYITTCSQRGRCDITWTPQVIQEHNRQVLKIKPGTMFQVLEPVTSRKGFALDSCSQVQILPERSVDLRIIG